MLAQWRTFESAANSYTASSPSQKPSGQKLSHIGKKMIDELQQFLPELTKWLRLTDEELLHQSFALLQSLLDCFKKTGVQPSEVGVQKLTRHIEGSQNKDAKIQTRLDSARILKLEAALAAFEYDDDIEIISHTLPTKTIPQQKLPKDKRPTVDLSAEPPHRTTTRDTKPSTVSKAPPSQSLPRRQSHHFTAKDEEKLSKDTNMPRLQSVSSSSRRFLPKDARHSPPAEKILPSSEESSDEGSDREPGLAALGKFQRTPQFKKPAERRQTKMLELPTIKDNSAKRRLRERDDARRRALRMKPDIASLHRTILSWAYDHTGPDPPSSDPKNPLTNVPDRFSNYDHYQRIFEPLLLLECWAQILQSKEEPTEMFQSKVVSRQFVDDFIDFDLAIIDPLTKGWSLGDNDVILLRQPEGKHPVMGKVLNFKVNAFGQQHVNHNTGTSPQHAVQVSVRCYFGKRGDSGLQIGTTWQIRKVLR
jgi:senataxin